MVFLESKHDCGAPPGKILWVFESGKIPQATCSSDLGGDIEVAKIAWAIFGCFCDGFSGEPQTCSFVSRTLVSLDKILVWTQPRLTPVKEDVMIPIFQEDHQLWFLWYFYGIHFYGISSTVINDHNSNNYGFWMCMVFIINYSSFS